MITRLRPWLTPPVFPADQEKTRVAGVLHTASLAILAGLGVFIIFDRSISGGSILRLLIEGATFLITLALLLMMRHGYVRLASVAFTISLWLAATAAGVLAGGVRAPALGIYLTAVLSAGVLLSWRAMLGFAGLSLAADLVLLYLTNAGILPGFYYPLTNNAYGIGQIIFLLWGTLLLSLARRSVDDALRRMRQELAERRRAEAALRESEARYHTLVRNFPNGAVLLFDHDLRYTLAEGTGLAEAGLSRSALEGKTIYQAFAPDTCQIIEPPFRAALDGTPTITDVPFQDRIYRMHTLPVADALGTVVAGMVMTQDITVDKRAEVALKESEERYARLADATFEGIAFHENQIIFDANARLATMLGYMPDELIGMPTEQLVAPESRDLVRPRVLTGYQGIYEHLALRKDGSVFPVEVRSRFVQYQGRSTRVTVVRDLSERLAAARALARSEQKFKNLVQSVNAVVWEADATTFQFSFVSEQAEKLLGYPTADWLARPTFWADHIHPDDRDAAVSYCVRRTQALEHHEFEYRMLAADGRIVWLRDLVTVEAREGQPQTLRGVMVDITAGKQAEEEVQLLQTASLAISTAPDLHAALGITLQLVSEATGWDLGQAWTPRADGAVIECSAAWWSSTPGLEAFRRHSETTTMPPGVGLPGRVWQSKQTAWLQDVTQDANFPRGIVAQEVGLKAGVAFPVLVGAEVMAVLEFFIVEPRVEDAWLVKLVSTVAAQLGTVIQRKRAEDALRVSEARFRAIFEGAAIGIALVDMNGQPVASNPALRETLGYSAEELHQMRFTQFTHPDDIQADWGLFEELIAGQRDAYQMEKRYYRKDGALIWARLTASLVRDTGGQPQFVIGMAEDITARKRAEEELRRSAERLHSLHMIDQAILAARSPEAVSEAALQRMRRLVPYQWAYVSLFNFAVCEMTVLASCGSSATRYPAGTRLPLGILPDAESLIEGLRQGRVRVVEEVNALAPSSVENQTLPPDGLRSYILIPLLTQGELVGSLLLGMDRPGAYAPDDIDVAQEVASQLAVAIQQGQLFAQVRAGHERLQSLSRKLIEAQEAERRHIARELHDEIGQALALIKLNIRAVQQMAHTSDLAPRLEQSLGIIEATLLRVRTLALDLRPAMLDDLGLVAALRWYVDQQAQVSDLVAEVRAETNGARLPPETETTCFRVVQEALTNIVRHAHAHQVQVQLEQSADAIQLTIQDDGVGFDSEQAWARAAQGASGGLLGMHERVALCGGQLRIESAPVSGTTIHVWIPLESPLAGMPTTGEEVPDVIDPRGSGG